MQFRLRTMLIGVVALSWIARQEVLFRERVTAREAIKCDVEAVGGWVGASNNAPAPDHEHCWWRMFWGGPDIMTRVDIISGRADVLRPTLTTWPKLFPALKYVYVVGPECDATFVLELAKVRTLRQLTLVDTGVTADSLVTLLTERPKIKIKLEGGFLSSDEVEMLNHRLRRSESSYAPRIEAVR